MERDGFYYRGSLDQRFQKDSKGNIWAVGEGGLFKYSSGAWSYYGDDHKPFQEKTVFIDIHIDKEDNLYLLGTNTLDSYLHKVNTASMSVRTFDNANTKALDTDVWSMEADSKGNLFLNTGSEGILAFNGTSFSLNEVPSTYGFTIDKFNHFWTGGYETGKGLVEVDQNFQQNNGFTIINSNVPFDWIDKVFYNKESNSIWWTGVQGFNNTQGVGVYYPENDFYLHLNKKSGLPSHDVTSLCFKDDQVWVGTEGDGLYMVDMRVSPWLCAEAGMMEVNVPVGAKTDVELPLLNCGSAELKYELDMGLTVSWLKTGIARGVIDGKNNVAHSFTCDAKNIAPGTYMTKLKVKSNGGDVTVDVKIVVGNSAAITSNVEGYLKIKAFPNPCTDKISMESRQEIESICLYDLNGKMLMKSVPNDPFSTEIRTSHLPNGNYLMVVRSEGKDYKQIFEKL